MAFLCRFRKLIFGVLICIRSIAEAGLALSQSRRYSGESVLAPRYSWGFYRDCDENMNIC